MSANVVVNGVNPEFSIDEALAQGLGSAISGDEPLDMLGDWVPQEAQGVAPIDLPLPELFEEGMID